MIIEKVSGYKSVHQGCFELNAYVYKNIFDSGFFKNLKFLVDNILENKSSDTFLTHKTVFKIEDQTRKIISHKQNNRKQHVLWDMISQPEYYFNTTNTIKDWADNKLKELNSLFFYKTVKIFESAEPLNLEFNKWVPMRAHINIYNYDQHFTRHRDGDPIWFNVDIREARLFSCTVYLDSVSPGGELWTDGGFVYKPEANTAIMFNGNQVYHGVNNNLDPRKIPRKAFTIRWVHIDDLFLPGHPSKTLYKVDHAE